MNALKKQAGMTLTELVTALSVLAVLVALSAPSYSQFISKRNVAGAADLVATFFQNAKMESVKHSQYVSVSYKKDGTSWCLGAKTGSACDCLQEPGQCEIGLLSSESHPNFDGLLAVFDEGTISYDPVRGILTDPEASANVQIQHNQEDFRVNISVNAIGNIRKCSPSGHELVGYAICI